MQRTAQPAAPALPVTPGGFPASALEIEVGAATDRGQVRAVNQDAYGFSATGRLFVLCDGMGGAAGGEIASRVTIETVLDRLAGHGDAAGANTPLGPRIVEGLEEAVAAANRILWTRAEREPELAGMGTTLVALVLRGRRAWVMHVGDSRCYLLRDGVLTRCTEDHSLVAEQVRLGMLSEEDAERSPLRNVITRAVGVREGLDAEVAELGTLPRDVFLLCSDGLTREVPEERIRVVLEGSATAEAACRELVDEANRNGGRDNITCVAVRLR